MPLIILGGIAVAIYLFKDKIAAAVNDFGGGGGSLAVGGSITPVITAATSDIMVNNKIIQANVPPGQVQTRVNVANEYIAALTRSGTLAQPSINKAPSIVKASLKTGMAVVGGKIVTPGQLLAGELLAVKALKVGGK